MKKLNLNVVYQYSRQCCLNITRLLFQLFICVETFQLVKRRQLLIFSFCIKPYVKYLVGHNIVKARSNKLILTYTDEYTFYVIFKCKSGIDYLLKK